MKFIILILLLLTSCQNQKFEVYNQALSQSVYFDGEDKRSELEFSFQSSEDSYFFGELISPSGLIWKFDFEQNDGTYSSGKLGLSENALHEVGLYTFNIIDASKIEYSDEIELYDAEYEKQLYSLSVLPEDKNLYIKEYEEDTLLHEYLFDINRDKDAKTTKIEVIKKLPHGYKNISINYI